MVFKLIYIFPASKTYHWDALTIKVLLSPQGLFIFFSPRGGLKERGAYSKFEAKNVLKTLLAPLKV